MGCDLVRTSGKVATAGPEIRSRFEACTTIPLNHLGFDISRRLRHKNERTTGPGYDPNIVLSDVQSAGSLSGISNVKRGFGLDIQVMERSRQT